MPISVTRSERDFMAVACGGPKGRGASPFFGWLPLANPKNQKMALKRTTERPKREYYWKIFRKWKFSHLWQFFELRMPTAAFRPRKIRGLEWLGGPRSRGLRKGMLSLDHSLAFESWRSCNFRGCTVKKVLQKFMEKNDFWVITENQRDVCRVPPRRVVWGIQINTSHVTI